MLPRCSELHWDHLSDMPGPAYASWQALTSRAARIKVAVHRELHVVGAGSSAPENLVQPWQLEIHASAVHGLPASQPAEGCIYFLQNAAARAAGWTFNMQWSR